MRARRVALLAAVGLFVFVPVAPGEPGTATGGVLAFLRESAPRPHPEGTSRTASVMQVDSDTAAGRRVAQIRLVRHAWSPDGRRLAFLGGRACCKASALFVLDLATAHRRLLLRHASALAWSADGRQLVAVGAAYGRRGLVVVDATGRRRPRLIVAARSERWIWGWSPDGSWIAYGFTIRRPDDDNENGRQGLAVVATTGKPRPHVVVAAEKILSAEWSPDSTSFTYVKIDGKYTCCEVYVVGRDGAGDHAVAGGGLAQALGPEWSPDGRLIAYGSWGQGGTGVHVVAPDGRGDHVLTSKVGNLVWSPDGSRIAFVRGDAGGTRQTIVVVRGDGGAERSITTNTDVPTGAERPVWSPDGRTIAYVGTDESGVHVHVVDADGTNRRQLTSGQFGDTSPHWQGAAARR